jgi:ABC-2 type transport system ATP-binding protein/lipopolysaccharide transport system ATP-binding protein
MEPESIAECEEDIVAFSELGDYIDLPVRTYSTGMRMRLAFAISMAVQADILLLDEVLGVGDSAFQQKAKARLHEVAAKSGIVVLALHSSPAIMEMCNKALWLNHGRVCMLGDSHEVVRAYDDFMHGRSA